MTATILCTLMVSATIPVGVRLDLEAVDARGGSGEQRIELQGGKVRVDHFTREATSSGGVNHVPSSTVIFNGREIITIDHRSKTYVAIDLAQARPQADPGKIAFKKGLKGDRVSGFACTNYTELRNDVERGTVCLAAWKTSPVKQEDLSGVQKFAQTLGASEASAKAMLINPADWPGFPLSLQMDDGQITVKSAMRVTIPQNEFAPPVDYTRKALP